MEEVAAIIGHSIWVGATQDLLALNIHLASVMQAGPWKSIVMPIRYGEEALAARGGMARAATGKGGIRTVSVRDRQKAQIRVVICHAMHPNYASGPERDCPEPR